MEQNSYEILIWSQEKSLKMLLRGTNKLLHEYWKILIHFFLKEKTCGIANNIDS